MEHLKLQDPEDYQVLFESFLAAAGISPAEFKAYLAAKIPHCGALHVSKVFDSQKEEYDGVYLSESSYILIDSLIEPELRVTLPDAKEYLALHGARLLSAAELKRFDAWKESLRCVLAKNYPAENIPRVYSPSFPVTPEYYWTAENAAEIPETAVRSCVAVCDEISISPALRFLSEVYRKMFAKHFSY